MKKLLLLIAALIAVFCVYVALQPADMRVARSAVMAAAPEAIFPHINSLKKFNDWSPWAKLDPNATMTYSGPDQGEGATAEWKGNHEVGAGTMVIVGSTPAKAVEMKLEFVEPWPGTADVQMTLAPKGANATEVTWAMDTTHGFVDRAMCILLRMDPENMVGEKYEEGLANLKKIVEAGGGAS